MEKYFSKFPELKTKRLTLRAIGIQDAERILEMRKNNRVNQFIMRDTMENIEQARQLVEKVQLGFEQKKSMGWAGVLTSTGEMIGTCGFNSFDLPNLHSEIGGELSTAFWGKNIAQEAFEAIIHFGLFELGLHTIEAKVSPDNRGAIALLTAFGFMKEAHYQDRIFFNDQFYDMAVYSLIKK